LIGATVSRLRLRELAASLEEHAEVGGGFGMAALIGAPEGALGLTPIIDALGLRNVIRFHEHCAEIKRAKRVAAFVSAAVRRFCTGRVTALLQQRPEMGGGRGVAEVVSTAEGGLGPRPITLPR
jgi:hypothetical protein